MFDFTVVIATCNRASYLEDTLNHLANVTTSRSWEVVVVDNNSTDATVQVLTRLSRGYPVPVRTLKEPIPGKYGALNVGIRAARGYVIAATDDDARVEPDWLDRAWDGLAVHQCGFVGGPVRPLWDREPPAWLDVKSTVIQKVIAICDYGPVPRELGVQLGWPLGVNVAYKREVFERVGLFDNSLGRKAGTLRSQSQREWHLRARAAGIRGFYLPDMLVHHRVIVERLKKQYFRRWHYWHGISRASLYWRFGFDPEEPEALRHARPIPEVFGIPRPFLPKTARAVAGWASRTVRGDSAAAFDYELWLCFVAGFVQECRHQRKTPFRAAVTAFIPTRLDSPAA